MFSISTIASSTSRPITSDNASSVTVFSVKPMKYIAANVGMIDSGSADAETSVARQSRRNSHTTRIASIAPSHIIVIDDAVLVADDPHRVVDERELDGRMRGFRASRLACSTSSATPSALWPRARVI